MPTGLGLSRTTFHPPSPRPSTQLCLSVCLCLSVSARSVSLSLSLSVSACLPVCLYLSLSASLSLSVCLCLSLSLSLSVSLSMSVCLCFCVPNQASLPSSRYKGMERTFSLAAPSLSLFVPPPHFPPHSPLPPTPLRLPRRFPSRHSLLPLLPAVTTKQPHAAETRCKCSPCRCVYVPAALCHWHNHLANLRQPRTGVCSACHLTGGVIR